MWHIRAMLMCILFLGTQQIGVAQASQEKKDSLLQFLEVYQENDSVRVNALIDLQEIYLVDDYQAGLPFIEEALRISRDIAYNTGEGFSLNALGAYYLKQGDNERALTHTLEAIQIFDRIGEDQNIYAAFNNLALIYKRIGKLEKAAETYLDMLSRLEGKPRTPSFVVVYYNLASTYQAMGDMANYEDWLTKMLDLAESLQFPLGIVEGRLGLAQIAVSNGEFERALEMSVSLLPQLKRMSLAQPEARAYKTAAAAHHGLGQYNTAMAQIRQAEHIYTTIGDLTQLADVLSLKKTILRDQGSYKAAFETSERYHQLQDSLLSEERLKTIEELQTKYETARIEREKNQAEIQNLRLTQENRQSRSLLFSAAGLLMVGLIAGGFYSRQQTLRKESELKDIELKETQKRLAVETQKREAELKAIRSQLNPHFIFNILNSAQGYVVSGDASKANTSLSLVSELMQRTLKHSQQSTIPLADELSLIATYIEAETLRFDEPILLNTNLDEEIEAEFIRIPPMLLQPYVENAVKHGLRNKKTGSKRITISASIAADQLSVIIEDNGIGRTRAREIASRKPADHNHFSMEANRQRLQVISEQSQKKAGVLVTDLSKDGEATGTRVELVLPILT